jgi:NADH-quinone oxidoreductase subunit J
MAFGILLTGRTAESLGKKEVRHRPLALLVGAGLFAGLLVTIRDSGFTSGGGEEAAEGTIEAIGAMLLGDYISPFEFASILLLVALVGAAFLVRREEKA